jgi:hypothetical protein
MALASVVCISSQLRKLLEKILVHFDPIAQVCADGID